MIANQPINQPVNIKGIFMRLLNIVAALGLFAAVSAVSAAVTFNPGTGTGFVGKGDVQIAFGWNNTVLQTNAAGVTFSYKTTDTYAATCTWTTGEGTRGEKTHDVDHTKKTSVNSTVAYELRKNNQQQITGFNLTGFGTLVETGAVPLVGGPCPGNQGHEGVWTAVEWLGSTGGGLFVEYPGKDSVLLSY